MAIGRIRINTHTADPVRMAREVARSVRMLERRKAQVTPTRFADVALLPGASLFPGRVVYVAGKVNATYISDGTKWKKVTVT